MSKNPAITVFFSACAYAEWSRKQTDLFMFEEKLLGTGSWLCTPGMLLAALPGGVSVVTVVVVSSRVTKLKREQEWLVLIEYAWYGHTCNIIEWIGVYTVHVDIHICFMLLNKLLMPCIWKLLNFRFESFLKQCGAEWSFHKFPTSMGDDWPGTQEERSTHWCSSINAGEDWGATERKERVRFFWEGNSTIRCSLPLFGTWGPIELR